MTEQPTWLAIARELRALAQTGLAFTKDPFDRRRYERLRELAATMFAQGRFEDYAMMLALFSEDQGYATPKIDVRGAAFVDERVLLVREISDGKWTLPGGWADVNQTGAQCVVREIAEESGFEARALKLAAVYDYQRNNQPIRSMDSIYKLFFICEITGGAPRPSDETSEVEFFSLDRLPVLSTGRTTAAQIERMFLHHHDPQLSTDFD